MQETWYGTPVKRLFHPERVMTHMTTALGSCPWWGETWRWGWRQSHRLMGSYLRFPAFLLFPVKRDRSLLLCKWPLLFFTKEETVFAIRRTCAKFGLWFVTLFSPKGKCWEGKLVYMANSKIVSQRLQFCCRFVSKAEERNTRPLWDKVTWCKSSEFLYPPSTALTNGLFCGS